MIIDFNHFFHC